MIIATCTSNFSIDNVYYCKPIKNKVMNGGMFIRIIYSSYFTSINGIHLVFKMTGKIQEVYNNKFKHIYNVTDNKDIIDSIVSLEETVISNANINDKTAQYKLKDQIVSGFFKFFQNSSTIPGTINGNTKTDSFKTKQVTNTTFILKISGIWTTDIHYGITYKFIRVD